METGIVDAHDNPVRTAVFSDLAVTISRDLKEELMKWDPALAVKTEDVISRLTHAAILRFMPYTAIMHTQVVFVMSRGGEREAVVIEYGFARRLCDVRQEFAARNGIAIDIVADQATVKAFSRIMAGIYPRRLMDEILAELTVEEAAEIRGEEA